MSEVKIIDGGSIRLTFVERVCPFGYGKQSRIETECLLEAEIPLNSKKFQERTLRMDTAYTDDDIAGRGFHRSLIGERDTRLIEEIQNSDVLWALWRHLELLPKIPIPVVLTNEFARIERKHFR